VKQLSLNKKLRIRSSPEDGFAEEEARRIIEYTLKLAPLKKTLSGKRYRVLRTFSDQFKDERTKKRRYASLVIYNYSDDLTHSVRVDLQSGKLVDTREHAVQPGPSSEEYEEAIKLIRKNQTFEDLLSSQRAVIQNGLIVQDSDEELPAGIHRCLEMFLLTPERDKFLHRLVIDLSNQTIVVNEVGGS